jgi:hypothetical protein
MSGKPLGGTMRSIFRGRVPAVLVAVGLVTAACGHGGQPAAGAASASPIVAGPHGIPPDCADGHGGPPGTVGYWLSWAAVDTFTLKDSRQVTPGVDRQLSPTPAPDC